MESNTLMICEASVGRRAFASRSVALLSWLARCGAPRTGRGASASARPRIRRVRIPVGEIVVTRKRTRTSSIRGRRGGIGEN